MPAEAVISIGSLGMGERLENVSRFRYFSFNFDDKWRVDIVKKALKET